MYFLRDTFKNQTLKLTQILFFDKMKVSKTDYASRGKLGTGRNQWSFSQKIVSLKLVISYDVIIEISIVTLQLATNFSHDFL